MTILKSAAASLIAVVGLSTASLAQPTAQHPADEECPAFVQGSKLVVTELPDGVKITISTQNSGNVAPLRNAARSVVDLIKQHEQPAANSDVSPAMTPVDEPQFPPMAIDVQDVAHGVVVTIHAKNKSDVADVRKEAHALDQVWQSSTCINPEMTSRT